MGCFAGCVVLCLSLSIPGQNHRQRSVNDRELNKTVSWASPHQLQHQTRDTFIYRTNIIIKYWPCSSSSLSLWMNRLEDRPSLSSWRGSVSSVAINVLLCLVRLSLGKRKLQRISQCVSEQSTGSAEEVMHSVSQSAEEDKQLHSGGEIRNNSTMDRRKHGALDWRALVYGVWLYGYIIVEKSFPEFATNANPRNTTKTKQQLTNSVSDLLHTIINTIAMTCVEKILVGLRIYSRYSPSSLALFRSK